MFAWLRLSSWWSSRNWLYRFWFFGYMAHRVNAKKLLLRLQHSMENCVTLCDIRRQNIIITLMIFLFRLQTGNLCVHSNYLTSLKTPWRDKRLVETETSRPFMARPRRDTRPKCPRPRRDRDNEDFDRDETETRRRYVSRPSRDRDVETETTSLTVCTC